MGIMKVIDVDPQKPEKEKIDEALRVLKEGGIVLYPTDTVYGLAVNINDNDALKRLYNLKNRQLNKPISICVSDLAGIDKVAYMDDEISKKVSEMLPGPFTVILTKKDSISPILTAGTKKIGIRIPNSPLCWELTREFPITTSSANISGMKTPCSINEIINQLGENVDLVLNAGDYKESKPSTVIDFTVKPPKILRKGVGIFK
jgi:L-threonylcarbamoyladenylate synthase